MVIQHKFNPYWKKQGKLDLFYFINFPNDQLSILECFCCFSTHNKTYEKCYYVFLDEQSDEKYNQLVLICLNVTLPNTYFVYVEMHRNIIEFIVYLF